MRHPFVDMTLLWRYTSDAWPPRLQLRSGPRAQARGPLSRRALPAAAERRRAVHPLAAPRRPGHDAPPLQGVPGRSAGPAVSKDRELRGTKTEENGFDLSVFPAHRSANTGLTSSVLGVPRAEAAVALRSGSDRAARDGPANRRNPLHSDRLEDGRECGGQVWCQDSASDTSSSTIRYFRRKRSS